MKAEKRLGNCVTCCCEGEQEEEGEMITESVNKEIWESGSPIYEKKSVEEINPFLSNPAQPRTESHCGSGPVAQSSVRGVRRLKPDWSGLKGYSR
jgi:hypothetical protein